MSEVRQYIGARYVIKVYENSGDPSLAEWEPGVTYEPLTMVTYNNSSYLSKKDVPGSVGDPASNPSYWVVTGAYNGQIAFLQDQIDALKGGFSTPQMFGAEGDGVTDDTTAFNDMFSAVSGTVFIPAGSYLLSGPVSIGSDTHIICEGLLIDSRSTDEARSDVGLLDIDNKVNVTVEGVRIKASGTRSAYLWGSEIGARNRSKNIAIRDCYIEDTPFCWGIVAANECDGVTVDNCYIEQFSYGGICNLNGSDNFNVTNCTVHTSIASTATGNLYPISLGVYNNDYYTPAHIASKCSAIGNHVKTDVAIWEGIETHATDDCTIVGNTVEGTYSGIMVVGGTIAGNPIISHNVTIADNTIIGPDSGTRLAQNNQGVMVNKAENVTVTGNVIRKYATLTNSGTKNAIMISDSKNVVFSDNFLSECGVVGEGSYGINTYNAENVIIKNNQLVDSYHLAAYRTGVDKNVYFEGNVINNYSTDLCSAPSLASDGYVRIKDNDTDVTATNITKVVPQCLTTSQISSVVLGRVGDIIYNSAPASGAPLGWICTVAYVSGTPATYIALANIA